MTKRVILFGIMVLFGLYGLALSCWVMPVPYELDPREKILDHSRPTAPILSLRGISRGHGAIDTGGGGWALISTADGGWIGFTVTGAKDDRTRGDDLGYQLKYIDGTLPTRLDIPSEAYLSKDLRLFWIDDALWHQDPFSFRVAVVAVDRGGNKSRISNIVTVTHDGSAEQTRKTVEAYYWRMQARIDSLRALKSQKD